MRSHSRSAMFKRAAGALLATGAMLAAGCAQLAPTAEVQGKPSGQIAFAVTADQQLARFDIGQPGKILDRRAIGGLAAGDRLVGIDFRVARGVLYGVGAQGNLYTIDTRTATATRVNQAPLAIALEGKRFGVDFNPVADRVRVVSDSGQNLRLHPDTGALVDGDPNTAGVQPDPALRYADGDVFAGRAPQLAGAAYTYNKNDDKLTTNYAIDLAQGTLVTQGTKEGAQPAVSPNTGRLYTVGSLGLPAVADAGFDIRDTDNAAYAVLRLAGEGKARLYRIDLASGKAVAVGLVGDGGAVQGFALEP